MWYVLQTMKGGIMATNPLSLVVAVTKPVLHV